MKATRRIPASDSGIHRRTSFARKAPLQGAPPTRHAKRLTLRGSTTAFFPDPRSACGKATG